MGTANAAAAGANPRLWRYHKPEGLAVDLGAAKGKPTIFDELREKLPPVVSVGQLDLDTEGLLLLTNDSEFERLMELPAAGWVRRYRVHATNRPDPLDLARLESGVDIEGVRYGPVEAKVEAGKGDGCWLTVAIREGRNREVRRVCRHLGLRVSRLIRTGFGPFTLGDLPSGGIDEIPQKMLKEQLGGRFSGHADRRGKVQGA